MRVVSRLITGVVWALAVVGICTAAMYGLVRAGVVTTLHVISGSMEPTFAKGDALVATPVAAADIEVGDIITTFDTAGRFVTHRVVDVGEGTSPASRLITMKGDANESVDASPYLVEEALKTRLVVPRGAAVTNFLTTTPVPQLTGLVVVCLIAYTFVVPAGRWAEDDSEAADPGLPAGR